MTSRATPSARRASSKADLYARHHSRQQAVLRVVDLHLDGELARVRRGGRAHARRVAQAAFERGIQEQDHGKLHDRDNGQDQQWCSECKLYCRRTIAITPNFTEKFHVVTHIFHGNSSQML